jgi:peptidoglycan/LPS O-acetylase OafA/YrhL
MRIEQLTFTRFVAALAIVIFHDGLDVFPFYLPAIQSLFVHAYAGVSYFFILSGFVMVVAYSRNQQNSLRYSTYYANRFARIYPAYFIALMLVVILYLVSGQPVAIVSFVSSLFLLQAWIPGYAVTLNAPGWSLSVELFFYLVFPLFFNSLFRKKDHRTGLLIAILSVWCVTQIVSTIGPGFFPTVAVAKDIFYYSPLIHVNEFLVGNVCALLFLERQGASNYRNADLAIILIFVLMVCFVVFNTIVNIHNGLLALFFAPLILLLSYNTGFLSRLFKRPSWVLLGEISYGIYIYQKPVKYYLYKFYSMFGIGQKELCFYGFLVALILFSYVSYRFIERPVGKLITSRLKPQFRSSFPTANS